MRITRPKKNMMYLDCYIFPYTDLILGRLNERYIVGFNIKLYLPVHANENKNNLDQSITPVLFTRNFSKSDLLIIMFIFSMNADNCIINTLMI